MTRIKFLGPWRSGAALSRFSPSASRILFLAFITVVAILTARPAIAQNTGSIYGSVEDSSGAVIPGAVVTATDPVHAITRTVKSNSSGEFTLSGLSIGTYTLTVTSLQFESSVITGIRVDANADIKETVRMVAGSTAQTVTVV